MEDKFIKAINTIILMMKNMVKLFDFKGWHWGVIDAITGKLIKDAVKGRRLDVH